MSPVFARVGLGLFLAFGLALVVDGAVDISEWFRKEPVRVSCDDLTKGTPGRWYTTTCADAGLSGHLEEHGSQQVLVPGKAVPSGRSLLAFFLGTAVLAWGLRQVMVEIYHRRSAR